ncbi:hypothetical membrane protein, DUF3397 family [Lactiplantibacillus plantarum]|nr:hypothetical membrane protein, DUF3397 family [Lactiplantibacillus plantarum]
MDHLVRTIDFISGRFSRDFSAETSIAPFLAARIKINGFLAPFLMVFTHYLTLQATDSSLAPYEVLSLMILGIGLTIIEAVERGEILYWRFFKLFWRGTELLTLVVYLLALGSHFFLQ